MITRVEIKTQEDLKRLAEEMRAIADGDIFDPLKGIPPTENLMRIISYQALEIKLIYTNTHAPETKRSMYILSVALAHKGGLAPTDVTTDIVNVFMPVVTFKTRGPLSRSMQFVFINEPSMSNR